MNIASAPKSIPTSSLLSPDANQAAPASATGVLTVDLDAIVANWRKLEKTAVPAECAGVVKADAYGCGAEQVARALHNAGCKTFFVATLDEARVVRAALPTVTIYTLDGFFQNTGDAYAKLDCKPVIGDLNELAEWDVFCRRSGWSGGAAIHIDTGMNRLGLTVTEAHGIIPRINAGDHGITLVMSHLASAELLNNPVNARQLTAFREIASLFSGVPASLANSSGVFLGPQFQFEMVRPGAAIYGVNPTPEADNPMQPVIELKARIVQIRNLEKGETVGYGGSWTARRPSRIAIVSAGYADGYFRAASSNDGSRGGEVVVAGKRCPIAGRVSMDLMAVDVTDLDKSAVRRGHMVTLIGEGITVDELAHHFGTIGYEVLTSLGKRYARVYKGGDAKAEPPTVAAPPVPTPPAPTPPAPPAIQPAAATAEPIVAPPQPVPAPPAPPTIPSASAIAEPVPPPPVPPAPPAIPPATATAEPAVTPPQAPPPLPT